MKRKTKVIGVRKMIVIMWCVGAIAGIMFSYISYNKKLDAPALAGLTMIAGLGGAHTFRERFEGNSKNS